MPNTIKEESTNDVRIKKLSFSQGGLRLKGVYKSDLPEKPLISIITVVYNARDFFIQTIESILRQTYSNIELIIIDGASSDGTMQEIFKHEDKIDYWLSERDYGIYHAMNKGIRLASGYYINFLNAGDYFCEPDSLENLINEVLKLNKRPDFIYTDKYNIDEKGFNKAYYKAGEFTLKKLLKFGTAVVCHQTVFVKKEIAPLYDTRYRYKAELNWYFDILEQNKHLKAFYQEMPLIYYRKGGYGQKKYYLNALEWFMVVRRRYGVKVLLQEGILLRILLSVIYRYPWMMRIYRWTKRKKVEYK
jgi:glycosyltransferase involved in cell wall biosynthesis